MAEPGKTEVDAVELRVVEVKSALDVGMAEIKGSLALLVQASEHAKTALAEMDKRNKEEFARRDAERIKDQEAQAERDKDQEERLREVEKHVYKVVGAAAAVSVLLGALAGFASHFIH